MVLIRETRLLIQLEEKDFLEKARVVQQEADHRLILVLDDQGMLGGLEDTIDQILVTCKV